MWKTTGEDVNFLIEYVVEGEYVIPTSASATVRNDGGTPITGLIDVPLVVTTTQATITIPAVNNTVADGFYENRYISVDFTYEGKDYHRTFFYKVTPFLPITVGPDDVRRELGLDSSEAPDKDINILSAYFLLKVDYGQQVTDALTGGTEKTIAVNRAIAVKAALELVSGLQFRAAVKMKAEDSAIERMSDFDVAAIRMSLGRRLTSLLDVVTGTTTGGVTIVALSNPTDAITGE